MMSEHGKMKVFPGDSVTFRANVNGIDVVATFNPVSDEVFDLSEQLKIFANSVSGDDLNFEDAEFVSQKIRFASHMGSDRLYNGSEKSAGHDIVLSRSDNVCIDGVPVRSLNDGYKMAAGETVTIKTDLQIEIPDGFFGAVISRSGLASKKGIHVLNSPGIIDSDYRGCVGVVLHNANREYYTILPGDRVAQLIIIPFLPVDFHRARGDELTETARGDGGFGSTGK
jgi:dUTP pyrophosphatase